MLVNSRMVLYLWAVSSVKSGISIGPAALLPVKPEGLGTDAKLEVGHPGGPNVDDTSHYARADSHQQYAHPSWPCVVGALLHTYINKCSDQTRIYVFEAFIRKIKYTEKISIDIVKVSVGYIGLYRFAILNIDIYKNRLGQVDYWRYYSPSLSPQSSNL